MADRAVQAAGVAALGALLRGDRDGARRELLRLPQAERGQLEYQVQQLAGLLRESFERRPVRAPVSRR